MKLKKIISIVLSLSLFLLGCGSTKNNDTSIPSNSNNILSNENNTKEDDKPIIEEVEEPEFIAITISAIGDMLVHNTVYQSMKSNTGYDFHPMFEDIAPYISKSDFTIANLETVFAGAEMIYSNYPMFNTPEQLGYAMKNTLGVDLVTTNNNHSLDRGIKGLNKTIEFLKEYGLDNVGTYITKEESESIFIKDINGANIAFISYTYGTNGNIIPQGKEYSVSLIDKNKILSDCKKAEESGADFIVSLLHWGNEYQQTPSSEQRELAKWIFENTNSSLIIGNHPHVVQPIEEIIVEKDGQEKKGMVCYALGNFTGNQGKVYCDTGISVNISLKINKEDKFNNNEIQQVSYFPTYIDSNAFSTGKGYRTLNMNKAIYDYENNLDSLLTKAEYELMLKYKKHYQELVPKSSLVVEDTLYIP